MIDDFASIYLGPKCEAESDGRTWAHHDAWEPCECGEKPVRYVRADIHDALAARLAEAESALREIRIRLHASGRRPEECYEMSLIDNCLKPTDRESDDAK